MCTVRHSDAYAGPLRTKDWAAHGEGDILLNDNARPHVSRVTQMELDKLKWETVGPSALQFGHVALRFPCVWSTEETPEREALQLGRRTQGHCEGLGLVTAHRNPGSKESCGLFISGIIVLRPMVYILNKVNICTHHVVSFLFI
ncbi:histone-lysine N-methyltransferase SETMAR [Trichonephila clavipes]|nr:histone-lysine N-methyltransferase SETMAR [Trichonephila clavipes]